MMDSIASDSSFEISTLLTQSREAKRQETIIKGCCDVGVSFSCL